MPRDSGCGRCSSALALYALFSPTGLYFNPCSDKISLKDDLFTDHEKMVDFSSALIHG